MDVRRELDLINRHFRRHREVASEAVVWYEFLPLGSSSAGSIYDDVYDEGVQGAGGKSYGPGVTLPVLLVSETEDQRRLLVDMGCDYGQGYLFSRPIPAEEFEKLLLKETSQ